MPIVKRYTFQPRVSAGLASQFNTNFDDIIDAFNNHRHSGVGTDAPNITISGVQNSTLVGLKNPYMFYAYRSSAWTTGSSVYAKVAFNAETYDVGNCFDSTTNNRFTAPVAGYYHFSTAIAFDTTAGSAYVVSLYKNGAEIIRLFQSEADNVNAFTMTLGGSATLLLAQSDYVEVYVYASGQTGFTGATLTWFQGYLLSGV